MKKISILLLSFLLAFGITACGRNNNDTDIVPTTILPETSMPLLPDMDPTLDTNIPDPSINTEMPTYTDGTDPSEEMAEK